MEAEFKLSKQDYLTHQLFMVSESKSINYKRKVIQWVFSLVYIGVGILFVTKDTGVVWQGLIFMALGLAWFVFYPTLSKRRYRASCIKFIEKDFKDIVEQTISLKVDEKGIKSTNGISETVVGLDEANELVELKELFLLVLKSGMTLIIPKSVVGDVKDTVQYFGKLGFTHRNRVGWVWK